MGGKSVQHTLLGQEYTTNHKTMERKLIISLRQVTVAVLFICPKMSAI